MSVNPIPYDRRVDSSSPPWVSPGAGKAFAQVTVHSHNGTIATEGRVNFDVQTWSGSAATALRLTPAQLRELAGLLTGAADFIEANTPTEDT